MANGNEVHQPTIVMIPGFLGFRSRRLLLWTIDYFRGLERELRLEGLRALVASPPPTGTVTERGIALAAFIHDHAPGPLVLVGHSMGGLDARQFTARHDTRHQVVSVVTVGTPHRGSPVAEHFAQGTGPVHRLARSLWGEALADLTPEACERRNLDLKNRGDVIYHSFAGLREVSEMPLFLRPFGRIVAAHEGGNDGLVSVASATWGNFGGTFRADHLELVGWSLAGADAGSSRPFQHLSFFKEIVARAAVFPS